MSQLIVDSDYVSLRDAVRGIQFPEEIRKKLELVPLDYMSFDGRLHRGQMVLHRDLAGGVQEVFGSLVDIGFPIRQVIPAQFYDWDDDACMEANNSSGFNYRFILGTERLSNHSFGRAFDLNPRQNPYFPDGDTRKGCRVFPAGAVYDLSVPGTITPEVAKLFKDRGFKWGGDCWNETRDYQHFQMLN